MVAQVDTGTPLSNSKHERFANLSAQGKNDTEAYMEAFACSLATARASATRLRENVGIQARIAELKAASALPGVLSMSEKRLFLAEVVRSSVNKLNLNSPLINRIKRRIDETGATIEEIWLPEKIAAIMADSKLSGELQEQGFGNVRDLQLFIVQNMQVINGLADAAPADDLGDCGCQVPTGRFFL